MTSRRFNITIAALALLLLLLMLACLVFGSVDIPVGKIVDILSGKGSGNKAWDIIILQSRIPMIITAIMRVAMYEMLYMPEIPNAAAVNSAVEIAKKYETPETVRFINGILGSFARREPV